MCEWNHIARLKIEVTSNVIFPNIYQFVAQLHCMIDSYVNFSEFIFQTESTSHAYGAKYIRCNMTNAIAPKPPIPQKIFLHKKFLRKKFYIL